MEKVNYLIKIFLLFFCLLFEKSDHDLSTDQNIDVGDSLEIKFLKHGKLYLKNENSLLKKIDIELAEKYTEKRNGLKYRSFLEEDRGMLFIFQHPEEYQMIDMKNMRIPLDIVYINEYGVVVYIDRNISPMRKLEIFNPTSLIKYVLEINSGMSNKWGIKEGITKIYLDFNAK